MGILYFRTHLRLRKFILFWGLLFVNTIVFATPQRITFQSKIYNPDGTPLEAASVQFKFSLMNPLGTCVIYSETFSGVDMTSSGGSAVVNLGSGTRDYPVAGGMVLQDAFNNLTSSYTCQSSGTYSPTSIDSRSIVMQFNDGTSAGWQTLPAMAINTVPYSMFSFDTENFAGRPVTDFVLASALPTCAGSDVLTYDGTNLSCITPAGGGTVTSVTASPPLASSGGTTPNITITQASAVSAGYLSSADWTAFNNKLSSITSSDISVGAVTDAKIASVDWSKVANTPTTVAGYGITDSLTTATAFSGDISGAYSSIQVDKIKNIPVTLTSIASGDIIQYNGSAFVNKNIPACGVNEYLTFNGSVYTCVTDVGAGGAVGSINSLTGALNIVSGTGGSDFNISSAATTVTLNLPTASSTVRGALSSSDWTTFNNKLSNFSTMASSDVTAALGYTAASSSDVSSNYLNLSGGTVNGTLDVAAPMFVGRTGLDGTIGFRRSSDGGAVGYIGIGTGNELRINGTPGVVTLYTAGVEQVRLDATGKVGIGVTNPSYALEVSGDISVSGNFKVNGVNIGSGGSGTVTDVSGTAPISVATGSSTPVISMARATSSVDGYLSSSDWTTFNNKLSNFSTLVSSDITTALGFTPLSSADVSASQWSVSGSDVYRSSGKVGIGTSTPWASLDVWNGIIAASNSGITQPMTSDMPANTYLTVRPRDGSYGGADIWGYSGNSNVIGLRLAGAVGSNSPNPGVAGVEVVGYKYGSGSGTAAMGSSDTVFQVVNYTTNLVSVLGNGSMGIGTSTPAYKLDVAGDVNVTGNFKVNGVNISSGGSGTVTDVSGTAPISVATGSSTPVISMTRATSSVDGYLSSSDWTTFNNKLSAITSSDVTTALGYTPANVLGDNLTFVNKSAAYTVVSGDNTKIINYNSGTYTVTLPSAVTVGSGFSVTISNSGSGTILIGTVGGQNLDFTAATTELYQGQRLKIVSDGSNWISIGSHNLQSIATNYTGRARPIANGADSYAVGSTSNGRATASGTSAFAIGGNANATGNDSYAFGTGVSASGTNSTAIGTAAGNGLITASGYGSVAIGSGSVASNNWAVALGLLTNASGQYSMALGSYTTASSYFQTTVGTYNLPTGSEDSSAWISTDPLFVVGNGTGSGASRSNALMILKNGNVGIGTTTPSYALQVSGDISVSGNFKVNGVNIGSGGSGTVTNVSGTAPISVATGSSTPVISMARATSSVDGYLSSSDWTTFNNKLSAITSSDVTTALGYTPPSDPDIAALYLPLTGGVLTGSLVVPSNDFTVGSNQLIVTAGKVGIGTTTPTEALEVTGSVQATTSFRTRGFSPYEWWRSTSDVNSGFYANLQDYEGANSGDWRLVRRVAGVDSVPFVVQRSTGYIGVGGITTPAYSLDVSGDVNVTGNFKVNGVNISGLIGLTNANTTVLGTDALVNLTTGSTLLAIGNNALNENTSGNNNLAIGSGALYHMNTGSNNLAIGDSSQINMQGSQNLSLGQGSLQGGDAVTYSNNNGTSNTAIGLNALANVISGSGNTALGESAGSNITTGDNNLFLGSGANGSPGSQNSIAIGAGAIVSGDNSMVLGAGVNVGIGTSSPAYKLDVVGDVNVTGNFKVNGVNISPGGGSVTDVSGTAPISVATGSTTPVISISQANGSTNGYLSSGDWTLFNDKLSNFSSMNSTDVTTALGFSPISSAGNVDVVGEVKGIRLLANGAGDISTNVAVGLSTLTVNTTGFENTALGNGALSLNVDGNYNTAVGSTALFSNTSGSLNTATGSTALYNNTTGGYNTATGHSALVTNTSGDQNTATGVYALRYNTTGGYNTATGVDSLTANSTGSENTATGASSLKANSTGDYNVATGASSLYTNTTGHHNAAFGYNALYSNSTGNFNSAFGNNALNAMTTGSNNLGIGSGAGSLIVTGDNNVVIGGNNGSSIDGLSNYIIISDGAGTEQMRIVSSGDVGIGTTTPTAKLDVAGDINVSGAFKVNGIAISSSLSPGNWESISSSADISQSYPSYTVASGNTIIRLLGANFDSGKIWVDSGATLEMSGSFFCGAGPCDIYLASGATMTVVGSSINSGTLHYEAGAIFNPGDVASMTLVNEDVVICNGIACPTGTQFVGTTVYNGNIGVKKPATSHVVDVEGDINATQFCMAGDCKSSWAGISHGSAGAAWENQISPFSFNDVDPLNVVVFAGTTGNISGQGIDTGKIWVQSGGTLNIGGSAICISSPCDIYLKSGATLTVSGSAIFGGTLHYETGAIFNLADVTGMTLVNESVVTCNGIACPSDTQFSGNNTYLGNVGIGISTPSSLTTYKTEIFSANGTQLGLSGAVNGLSEAVGVEFNQMTTTGADSRVGGAIKSIAEDTYTGGSGATYDAGLAFYSAEDGSNVERMRINSAGNVGIGTTSPAGGLEVVSSSGAVIVARNPVSSSYSSLRLYNDQNSSSRSLEIGYTGTAYGTPVTGGVSGESAYLSATGNYPMQFGTSNAFRMIIDGSGNVGIGTTTPGYLLQVGNAADGSEARANAWNTLSDERLKKDFKEIENPLDKILQLKGYTYYWNNSVDKSEKIGVKAQEVQKVFPQAVSEGQDGYLSVSYNHLLAPVISAIQELYHKFLDQEDKIKQLEQKNAELEKRLENIEKRMPANQ